MRKLASNEKRLLVIFLAACAICGGTLGAKALSSAHKNMQARLAELRELSAVNERWLAEKDTWEARARWMEKFPAPAIEPELAASKLLSNLQSSLGAVGATIVEQGFSPAVRAGNFQVVPVRLKISASFGSFAKWLLDLQQAQSYLGIKKLSIKSDGEPSQIICEVEITQYLQNRSIPE